MTNETAGIGHNRGPAFDAEALAKLRALAKPHAEAGKAWGDWPPIEDDEAEGKIVDFITGARQVRKQVEDTRKAEKQPHLDAGKAVDDAYKPILAALDAAIASANGKLHAWLKVKAQRDAERQRAEQDAAEAERRRLEAEAAQQEDAIEAERLRTEAEAAAKAAKAAAKAKPTQARSATGAGRTVSQRTVYEAEIKNWPLVIKHFQDAPELRDLVQRLANAEARQHKEAFAIPGAIVTTRKVTA